MIKHKKLVRYFVSLAVIVLMVGIAGWTDEKEILFPEMVALTIGLLIIDKWVWCVKPWQIVLLMSVVCVCRDLPAGEPDNADSSYFGMCAAGLAAYGKHCLSVSCFDHVRTGCVYPEDDGEIRVSKSDHSYAWAEADRERRRPMGDFACFCCFDIFTGY